MTTSGASAASSLFITYTLPPMLWDSGLGGRASLVEVVISLGSLSTLVGRLCSALVVSSSLIDCQWWQKAIHHMVLLTPTSKASTPNLRGPIIADIMSRLLACSIYHSLMVSSCLAALCVLNSWPLVLGLLIQMVLWPRLPLVFLLFEESLPFIPSSLHI